MANDNNNGDPNPGNGGGDPNKNPDGSLKTNNDGGKGKEGDQVIPKYRFDEVSNRLQTLEREKSDREAREKVEADKKLADDKKFEELSTKRQSELEQANNTIRTLKIQTAVERIAAKAGAVDPESVYRLLDQTSITVDDKGNLIGAEEAVKKLLEAKPFLMGKSGSPANIGGGSNPEQPTGDKKPLSWVKAHWADPKWCRDKHDDLDGMTGEAYLNKLEKDGLIDRTS
jgi:hypothetical protein